MNILLSGILIAVIVWDVVTDLEILRLYAGVAIALLLVRKILILAKNMVDKNSVRLVSFGELGNPKIICNI